MKNITVLSTNVVENYIEIDPGPGSRLDDVVEEACSLALTKGLDVAFDFNGVRVKVNKNSIPVAVIADFKRQLDRNQKAFMESAAYKEQLKDRIQRTMEDQKKIDALLVELPDLKGHDAWVAWTGQFAALNDNMHLNYPKHTIIERMCAAGYVEDACLEDSRLKTDRNIFARWMIGQAIGCLRLGMPIHPVAQKFAQDYRELFPARNLPPRFIGDSE